MLSGGRAVDVIDRARADRRRSRSREVTSSYRAESTLRQPLQRFAPFDVEVSVVIAAMNEEKNLPYVFSRLPEGLHEVILVDGHSVDDTVAVARSLRPDIRILTQSGRGKGNAMAEGFAACTGEIIVALDADGSTDPAEIPRFVSALLQWR